MVPGPSITAIGRVAPEPMIIDGEIFQPTPRSRAALAPVPEMARPPPPLAPSRFSGLMGRVVTLRSRAIFRASIGMVATYRLSGLSLSRPPLDKLRVPLA